MQIDQMAKGIYEIFANNIVHRTTLIKRLAKYEQELNEKTKELNAVLDYVKDCKNKLVVMDNLIFDPLLQSILEFEKTLDPEQGGIFLMSLDQILDNQQFNELESFKKFKENKDYDILKAYSLIPKFLKPIPKKVEGESNGE